MKTISTYTSVNLSTDLEIKIGDIKVIETVHSSICLNDNGTLSIDNYDRDIRNITYQGITINNYQDICKFIDFHKSIGINLYEKLREATEENSIISKSQQKAIIEFIKKIN